MGKVKITLEEAQQEFINRNLIPLFDEYKNNSEKLLAQTQDGYMIMIGLGSLKSGTISKFIHKSNPYTIYNIKLWCKLNDKPFELLSEEYINYDKKLQWKCLKENCGEIFEMDWDHILRNQNCSFCAGKQVGLSNCFITKKPEFIKYLKNKNDGYKYTSRSGKKIVFICPDCGYEKLMVINDFTTYGFSCPHCGDGISYPEKFMFNILNQLIINFQSQLSKTTFEWCNNYRYDFYIPYINCIIETHGMQHYEQSGRKFKSLKETQENDKIKMELALNNNIKNYIVIDCRKSELNFIKNNIMNFKLLNLLNFKEEDIDWLKCHEYACNSLVKVACDLWNDNLSLKEISNNLKVSDVTIRKYLYQGTKLNWCYYNGKEESIKFSSNPSETTKKKRRESRKTYVGSNNPMARKIICLTTNKIFLYITEGAMFYNLNISDICSCCKGRQKSAGKDPITGEKLIWMYYEDYILKII